MAESAVVRFLKWDPLYGKERPFQIFMDLLPEAHDRRKTNLIWEDKEIIVEDFRGRAREFHLDTHGFTTRRLPGFTDVSIREVIESEYVPYVIKMLRAELHDVGTVFIFDRRVRPPVRRISSWLTSMQIRCSRSELG